MAFPNANYVRMTVVKTLIPNPDIKWTNVYEFYDASLSGLVSVQIWKTIAEIVALFETNLMFQNATIDKIRIVDMFPADPSDPQNSVEFTPSPVLNGLLTPVSDLLPLTVCLHLKKETAYGRPGKVFMRNSLEENNVGSDNSPSFAFVAGQQAAYQAIVDSVLPSTGLDQHLTAGSSDNKLALISSPDGGSTIYARPVDQILVDGIVTNKFRKRWYNRESGGGIPV